MSHTYIPLDQYKRKWIFNHKDLPVSDNDKAAINPLTEKSAMQVWNKLISDKCATPDKFSKGDWPTKPKAWSKSDNWQLAWDAEETELPVGLAGFIHWSDDTRVYFCYEKYQVIETRWDVFVRNWKCFLFFDDGPLLVSKKDRQAVMFHQDGTFSMGSRG